MIRASALPAAVGLCANQISQVSAYVNDAQERLLMDPLAPDEGWFGGTATMVFNVQVSAITGCGFAFVTTPREVARLTDMAVCQSPMAIRNGFFEYLRFGRGLQPKSQNCGGGNCGCGISAQAYARDNVVTLSDFTAGVARAIRIFPTDAADVGRRVLVRGLDANGIPVTSIDTTTQQTISGEYVFLQFPFVDTINLFKPPLTGLDKEPTIGRVTFFTIDPATGTPQQLSTMEPLETTANYRRYLLNGLPRFCCDATTPLPVTITAQAKLDFVPVVSDPDYLIIQSIPAITEEAQSLRYGRMDTPAAAQLEQKHHAKALAILNGQIDHFEGKVSTAVNVPIFGSARMRRQPI
jgi:hypothetical protein